MPLIRCYSTLQFAITRLPARTAARIHLVPKRCLSSKSQASPVRYEPNPDTSPENVQNEFIQHTTFAFRNLGKILAYVGYGALIVGLVTATAYEGGHLWIERKMHIAPDEDAKRWGWEVEGWTGGDGGGTSPDLGFFGRHAVRAAWFSLHYNSPFAGTTISQANGGLGMGNLNVAPSDLESARIYLEEAMARVRDQHGKVRMDTVGSDLLERHAAVLERIGTRAALARAREEYLQILDDGPDARRSSQARFAVKIGDISERLGNVEAALTWWTRGITLVSDDNPSEISAPTRVVPPSPSLIGGIFRSAVWKWSRIPPRTSPEELSSSPLVQTKSSKVALPNQPPSSPVAQRTLVAALLSISAHYSKINQLKDAKRIQEHAISLIDAMVPMPMSSSSFSHEVQPAGQSLHHMYLLQRKSVLALHHAEVTYSLAASSVLRKAPSLTEPVTDLLTAASSSEVVAQVLTETSSLLPDVSGKGSRLTAARPKVSHPVASHAPLASAYGETPWLRASARSVLRDARRTAVEAWDLCGVLYREVDDGEMKAVECFERALGWAEEPRVGGELPGATTVEAWQSLWERYMEARGNVRGE